ncbi:oxidative stress defense protein [Shewanella algidipiscicola]|uniref:Oxidative stress defense protein n=1 Tax=Shewanella algidipiscicola TaxID=614070 RepID=A0ABQ4PB08_9GAMM|nr:oxidative stress defense protein [Shewanella algidipiscicola]GIU44757.1 oxidative stress defense protein [Shewanella algidipiscicola]
MKKTILATLTASLLSSTLAIAATKAEANELNFPHIETVGTSQVMVKADMAEINVEVVSEAKTPADAKANSDKAVADFLARLAEAGVERDQIHSANLSLQAKQQYDSDTHTTTEVGYRASRQVTVTVVELKQLNKILDTALEQGINRVNNISFTSSKTDELIAQARKQAIADAQQKAKALAAEFGTEVDRVWQIRYYDQRQVQPVMYRMDATPKGNVAESYQQAQTTVSDRVEVIYRLK